MPEPIRPIFGIPFYTGDLSSLLVRTPDVGLLVVPSAPVLADMHRDEAQLRALRESDLALVDSGLFVLLWLICKAERLPRISGLLFLTGLLAQPEFREPESTFWIMPSAADAAANCHWLREQGISADESHCYVAPLYPAGTLRDEVLLERARLLRPKFIVIALGGGVQERLGHFLRRELPYRPAIICIGAAIAFLSGRQARIPTWADRLFLGWLVRTLDNPKRYLPRYARALRLVLLVIRTPRADGS